MDLLLIPVLLVAGGSLIVLGVHGIPRLSLGQSPSGSERAPFNLMDWLNDRPPSSKRAAASGYDAGQDAELVELMNEMIAVREELSGLKQQMAAKPVRRRVPQKTTTRLRSEPSLKVSLPARADVEPALKLPLPVKSAEPPSDKKAPATRPSYNGHHRRYVRT